MEGVKVRAGLQNILLLNVVTTLITTTEIKESSSLGICKGGGGTHNLLVLVDKNKNLVAFHIFFQSLSSVKCITCL